MFDGDNKWRTGGYGCETVNRGVAGVKVEGEGGSAGERCHPPGRHSRRGSKMNISDEKKKCNFCAQQKLIIEIKSERNSTNIRDFFKV